MDHGIRGYFAERARFERRVALTVLGVGLAFLALLGVGRSREAREHLDRTVRFGYEGPEQYVRRLSLMQTTPGSQPGLTALGAVDPGKSRTSGVSGERANSRRSQAPPRSQAPRLGDTGDDASMAELRRRANLPTVQSEELIIARKREPRYPPLALEEGREGEVKIQALIDTAGKVVEVEILSASGEEFGVAAAEAVWQFRFHPYRVAGVVSDVYTILRFNFRIY